ncbi:MAG: hypothetical protein JRN45_00670 [Nitrososphaerota archaeon]|nr:hypothetical protein [Nitrososphaerota archaeon]
MADDDRKEERRTHASLAGLKARGWTGAMVRTFLGEPDKKVPNPHYTTAAPMRLYGLSRVETAEQTEGFRAAREKAGERSVKAQKTAQKKARRLVEKAAAMEVSVVADEELLDHSIRDFNGHKEEVAMERACEGREYDYEPATRQSDPLFLERIQVNFARHSLTDYDESLEEVAGRVGVREALETIRKKVYGAIAETYPKLADECRRQLERREAEEEMMRRMKEGPRRW